MLNFSRMVTAAICIVGCVLETSLQERWIHLNVVFQMWIFLEWLGYKYSGKSNRHDIVLSDLIPIMAQIIIMLRVTRC